MKNGNDDQKFTFFRKKDYTIVIKGNIECRLVVNWEDQKIELCSMDLQWTSMFNSPCIFACWSQLWGCRKKVSVNQRWESLVKDREGLRCQEMPAFSKINDFFGLELGNHLINFCPSWKLWVSNFQEKKKKWMPTSMSITYNLMIYFNKLDRISDEWK